MANLIIPVSVETGNSLQNLKNVSTSLKGLENSANQAANGLQNLGKAKGPMGLRQEIRAAENEVRNLVKQFGELDPRVESAARKVAQLKATSRDAADAISRYDFETGTKAFARSLGNISQVATGVAGAFAFLDDNSKESLKTIKNLQAALSFSQGIAALADLEDSFKNISQLGKNAFNSIVNGIVSATGATKAFSTALAATGFGLLAVGIGLAIDAISKYNDKLKESSDSAKKLKEENERLATAVESVRTSSQSYVDRQVEIVKNEEQIKDLEVDAEKNSKKIYDLKRKNLDLLIQELNTELSGKKGLISVNDELELRAKIFRAQREKERLTIQQNADSVKKYGDELKKLSAKKKEADNILFESRIAGLAAEDQQILKLQRQTLQNQATLIEAGNGDLLTLWAGYYNQVAAITKQGEDKKAEEIKKKREQELKDAIADGKKRAEIEKGLNDLAFSVRLGSIKDEYDRRKEEIQKNFSDEVATATANYATGLYNLEQYLQAVTLLRQKYGQQEQDNEKERWAQNQQIVADAIAASAEAIGTALGSGTDLFFAAFKSIGESLANYLIDLGKQAIVASQAILKLKTLIGTPQGIFAGVALIALGALIKAAFAKKSEKGFATGGYVYGPGTETSDSIPARLSRGEYVIQARSVRKYGRNFFDKINSMDAPFGIIKAEPWRAAVNRAGYAMGGLVDAFASSYKGIVNRAGNSPLITSEPWRAAVNRPLPDTPRVVTGNLNIGTTQETFMPFIAETKISGQDLKIILSRADRRYSNVT